MSRQTLKFLFSSLCIFHFLQQINARQQGDYRSFAGGAWNLPQHWEVFNNGNWQAAVTYPTQQDGKIEVYHKIYISADQVADQLIINPGAELEINPGVMLTVTNSADPHDLIVKGKILNRGMIFFSPAAVMKLDSASSYIHNTSNASSHVLDATQFHPQSDWIYRGNGTLNPPVSLSNRHYGNLSFESEAGSWSRTLSGSSGASCRDLKVDQNVILINNYTGLLQIGGSLILNGQFANGSGIQRYNLVGSGTLSGNYISNFFDEMTIAYEAEYLLQNNMYLNAGAGLSVYGSLNCDSYVISGNNNGQHFTLANEAWIKSSHPGAFTGTLVQFTTLSFNNEANYELTGNNDQLVMFPNPLMNSLKINTNSRISTLLNDSIIIQGEFSLASGSLQINGNSLHLKGPVSCTQVGNLMSDSLTSIWFSGPDSGAVIPSGITQLRQLGVNKPLQDITLKNNLTVHHALALDNGFVNTDSFTLTLKDSPGGGIYGGSELSFVKGRLRRIIPVGVSPLVFYPVGQTQYHPLRLKNVVNNSGSGLTASVYEFCPSGSMANTTGQSLFASRFWNLLTDGPYDLSGISAVEINGPSTSPVEEDSGRIVISTDDSYASYYSHGGYFDTLTGMVSSVTALNSCQLYDMGSQDGIYVSVADSDSPGINCAIHLKIKVFIEAYYTGNGKLRPVISPLTNPDLCDTILLSLHASSPPYEMLDSFRCILDTGGNTGIFTQVPPGSLCYISIRHRNSLETWSALPVQLQWPVTSYDFSVSAAHAFGSMQSVLHDGYFAMYSGDISDSSGLSSMTGDGRIDYNDLVSLESDLSQFLTGYECSDLNGDGIIDNSDYSLLENNILLNLEVQRP